MTKERAEEECTTMGEAYIEGYEQGKADGAREFAVWLAHWIGYSKEWAELELESYEKEQKGAENEI